MFIDHEHTGWRSAVIYIFVDKLPVTHNPLIIECLTPARLAAAASRRNTRAAPELRPGGRVYSAFAKTTIRSSLGRGSTEVEFQSFALWELRF